MNKLLLLIALVVTTHIFTPCFSQDMDSTWQSPDFETRVRDKARDAIRKQVDIKQEEIAQLEAEASQMEATLDEVKRTIQIQKEVNTRLLERIKKIYESPITDSNEPVFIPEEFHTPTIQ